MSAFSRQINETPQGCNLMPVCDRQINETLKDTLMSVYDRQTIETLKDNLYVGLRPTNYRKEDFE